MKVNTIQSQNFQCKKSCFISQDMQENVYKLLQKMHNESVSKQLSTDYVKISEIRGLKIGDAIFKDGKFLAKRDSEDRLIPYGKDKSMLEFDKTRLIIDNRTGKIIEHKKPFFKTWGQILKKAHYIILSGLNHYHDKNIVEKIMYDRRELTPAGKLKETIVMTKFMQQLDSTLNMFSDITKKYKE